MGDGYTADELAKLQLMQIEHTSWMDLVGILRDVGAVTRQDCESAPSARDTAGQRLFAAIREWGDALVELRRME